MGGITLYRGRARTNYLGPRAIAGNRDVWRLFCRARGLQFAYRSRTGADLDTESVVAAAADGERQASAALDDYCDRLARGLASVINILDPDAIVLGGGLSNIDVLYRAVPQLLSRYVFSDHVETPIVAAKHGDSSGVLGAARLWDD